jgi:hypothetical protein
MPLYEYVATPSCNSDVSCPLSQDSPLEKQLSRTASVGSDVGSL